MDPSRLMRIAVHLAEGKVGSGRGRPNQTDLRRATSTAYYALFHTLATACANHLAAASRSQAAWRQTYRALEHGHARNQMANATVMRRFPDSIQVFARHFADLQEQRHKADYDPDATFLRREVAQLLQETQRVYEAFRGSPKPDQRAFALYVLLRSRPD